MGRGYWCTSVQAGGFEANIPDALVSSQFLGFSARWRRTRVPPGRLAPISGGFLIVKFNSHGFDESRSFNCHIVATLA